MTYEEKSTGEREKVRKYTFTISLVGEPIGRTPEFVKEKAWEFAVDEEKEFLALEIWNDLNREVQRRLEEIGVSLRWL